MGDDIGNPKVSLNLIRKENYVVCDIMTIEHNQNERVNGVVELFNVTHD